MSSHKDIFMSTCRSLNVIGELAAPVVDKAAAAFYLSEAATSQLREPTS